MFWIYNLSIFIVILFRSLYRSSFDREMSFLWNYFTDIIARCNLKFYANKIFHSQFSIVEIRLLACQSSSIFKLLIANSLIISCLFSYCSLLPSKEIRRILLQNIMATLYQAYTKNNAYIGNSKNSNIDQIIKFFAVINLSHYKNTE